ncbi:TRAP transporter large permease [Desulfovibrio sp. OttesenSCG-928-G15]|nr:TRAP transporter large permease [Desulfovibrio sp. OttesenSCG-928-G15]
MEDISILTVIMASMFMLFLLGLPIYASLAISATLALLVGDSLPMSVIHNSLFDGLNIFPLLAIPCFVIAGSLMESGNITHQIVDVVKQMVGRTYGGLGITTILACTFFAAISGSGPGTVAAVGTLLIPSMVRNGYSPAYAASVASSGGTIGIMIPPSNPMIIYAILGNLSVTAMFTAGFVPGAIVGCSMVFTAWAIAKRNGFRGEEDAPPFKLNDFLKSCVKGSPALATPLIILGSIYSGFATPVEASVVAILWSLLVGFLINRALRPVHLYRALLEGAVVCGGVLLIVGASTLFGKLLTFEQAPQRLAATVLSISDNPQVVLLMIIGVLIILGMFMETLSTIIILVPVLLPVLHQLGINPIHFGVILVATNEMALLTPPLGVNLFVASSIARIPIEKIAIGVLPYLIALLTCILLFTFVPEIVLWLPDKMGMGQ